MLKSIFFLLLDCQVQIRNVFLHLQHRQSCFPETKMNLWSSTKFYFDIIFKWNNIQVCIRTIEIIFLEITEGDAGKPHREIFSKPWHIFSSRRPNKLKTLHLLKIEKLFFKAERFLFFISKKLFVLHQEIIELLSEIFFVIKIFLPMFSL